VILVGQRRPEQGHDSVAHHLVDGALVVVDRFHHQLEHGVEELARLLRVPISQQFHRPLEVGEEHGHLLALAFEGGLRGEDLLGEVLGGVGLRRCESCRLGPVTVGRLPAFKAELGANRQLGAALEAGDGEPGSTLQTEFRLRRVLVLAPGTLHAGPLLGSGASLAWARWGVNPTGRPRRPVPG